MLGATPSEVTLNARAAANRSWAFTPDRAARTAPARAALMAKFEAEVDPEGVLLPAERARRAESLRRSYFQSLAAKSARSRRRAKDAVADAESAEAELAELGGDAHDAA